MAKYEPAVFVAMRDGGLTNRKIATYLGINEATVRRGLTRVNYEARQPTVRTVLLDLAELLERRDRN